MIKTSVFLLSALICAGTCAASTDLSGFDLGSMGLSKRMEAAKEKAWHLARNPRGAVAGTAPIICTTGSSSGALSLLGNSPRLTGVSPLLVFTDASTTTDSATLGGANTPFQDVYYAWNFGDSGASGTGTWANGSSPNNNSRNLATGPVSAHTYVVPNGSGDQTFTITLAGSDGTSSTSCIFTVTAYDPNGSNGWPTTQTTCVAAGTLPVAGSGGCPAGASVLNQSNFATALSGSRTNKRALFKCGDTFTGSAVALSGTKWSIGAYGGCEGTKTSRPIFSNTTSSNTFTYNAASTGDSRIADINFQGAGATAGNAIDSQANITTVPYQQTWLNLNCNNHSQCYVYSQGAQYGTIDSVMQNMIGIGTYGNYNEGNPGSWTGNPFNNVDYQAWIGNNFNGTGVTQAGAGRETLRISIGRILVVSDNTFQNANATAALLKIHQGNTNNSCQNVSGGTCFPCTVGAIFATTSCWVGIYSERIVVSDNQFGGPSQATSGAQFLETTPQNTETDERLQKIIIERNYFTGTTGAQGGRLAINSGVNVTFRDNVCNMQGTTSVYPQFCFQSLREGSTGNVQTPTANEVYNNTCYVPTPQNGTGGQKCIGFANTGFNGTPVPCTVCFAANNLYYNTSSQSTVQDAGVSNTVLNNTPTSTVNPSFTNGSGSFTSISDFKPTANFTISCTPFPSCTSVPVTKDAFGTPWAPTWDLGAIHH